ncbi:uncharacterized protein LOC117319021 [Pecten maximus]|uniref:uncharacterized protein LOC117319021 n=1 Tax=Pecten maximus TaxID=6579 RepID=UPI0014585541|nr:uncharacterized protein LOC117319021 [Pecten maximus]
MEPMKIIQWWAPRSLWDLLFYQREKSSEATSKTKSTSIPAVANEKQLQAAAEDMALTELSSPQPQFSPARVVLDSLNLLNEESVVNPPTPIKLLHLVSPRRSPRLTALRDIENENESLKARVSILENQVSTLQFHQNNLWSEYEKLSYTVATLRQQSWMSQPQLTPTTSNVHPVVPTHTVHETSADEVDILAILSMPIITCQFFYL